LSRSSAVLPVKVGPASTARNRDVVTRPVVEPPVTTPGVVVGLSVVGHQVAVTVAA